MKRTFLATFLSIVFAMVAVACHSSDEKEIGYAELPVQAQEMREYEASKMAYRDIKNSIDTAKQKGIEEGMNQKALDITRNMLADGVDINLIMKYSGLTQEQIEKLK